MASLSVQLPRPGEQAVLLFAPGTGEAAVLDALRAHGGRLVDFGVSGNVAIARFADGQNWSDLHAMGVWLSFDSTSLIGCIVANGQ